MNARALAICVGLPASLALAQAQVQTDAHGNRALSYVDNGTTPSRPAGGGTRTGWTSLGPYGGDVWAVAVSPTNSSIVLAGIAPTGSVGGLMYRSTDGAATWTAVPTLANESVFDIAFTPAGVGYAATMDSVWKSTDNGATWTATNLGIGLNDQVFAITIDPANPSNLWAGVADAGGAQPVNILMSADGGATWTNHTPPLGGAQTCRAIAINPGNTQQIGAAFGGAFGGGQFWVSTDGGATWTNRSSGLPSTPENTLIHDGTRFLVGGGQQFGSQNFGLFASPDLGVTWTPLHSGSWPSLVVNKVAADPNNAANLFAATVMGVFRSTDSGATWQFGVGGTSQVSANAVRFAPASSSVVLVGGNSVGVYKSTDGGTTFNPSSFGIGALDVFSIASNPANPSDLAIAFQSLNSGGVYRSTDAGQHWLLQTAPPVRYNTVGYSYQGTLYAISDGPTGSFQESLYRRNPDGTWTPIGPNQGSLFDCELYALRFSHNNPNLILTGGADFGSTFGFKQTVWRSLDAGATWTKVFHGLDDFRYTLDIEFVEDGTDTTVLGSFRDNSGTGVGGVIRSADGGLTWGMANTGLPALRQPQSLARSATSTSTFYISNSSASGGTAGVYTSTDAGQTWAPTAYLQTTSYLDSDGLDGQTLYMVRPGSGGVQDRVYRSTDGGATFSLFSDNLPAQSGFSRSLVYAPGPTPRLLLSTNKGTFAMDLGAPCYANCDSSTAAPILNVQDFSCFLTRYAAGDSYANCDNSTAAPVLNVQDFSCFLTKYASGCP